MSAQDACHLSVPGVPFARFLLATMQILNEVSTGHRSSKAPPLVSVSHSTASSKKHDENERGRSNSRSSSRPSTAYYPYRGQTSQSEYPNPCSILSNGLPPAHRLSQGRVDLPSLRFAGSKSTHWPAPPPARASDGIPVSAATWFAPGSSLPPVIPLHRVHVEASEEDFEACEHTLMLQQTAAGAIPASGLAYCVACELTSNLWLCLTCGSLGCGRRQYRGGNGHALSHFEQTGHPVSLKLGTITPEGRADVWCYECEDLTLDPALAEHVSVFGIDVQTARKTEQTTAEIRAERVRPYSYPCPSQPARAIRGPAPTVSPGCATPSWSEIADILPEACEHTLMLQQTAAGTIPASGLTSCVACDLTSNLWLCLTCGSLGCGRRQYRGGNGHALNHFEQTGHPVSLKLGTITPEGRADVWCYECEDLTLDPALAEHVSVFGIDVKTARKTEQTTAEIRAERVRPYPYPCPSQPARAIRGPTSPVAPYCATPSWFDMADITPAVPSQAPQMPGISTPRMGYGSYPSAYVEPSIPYDPLGPRKHPRFWYADGDRRFFVEDAEYQLHSYLFSKATSPPYRLFWTGSKLDFDRFLSILYPADYSAHECKTAEEWASVLRLADKWGMQDIRRLAIAQLALCAGPVDKIVLGHQYEITEWLGPAYLALVIRKQSITVEEGAKLGVEALVRIRALEDEVFEDRTKYINEQLFCEIFASKLAM
ncbi:hypothetical protein C8R45DRAFT_890243 [Mycena sanguinolenta]|nr:hypothetical protein C8R45DRAFT_890243 [Mycena sanguinolenta]